MTASSNPNTHFGTYNGAIAGSDGIVPVYNPEARWTIWSLREIWFGKEGKGKYVPKVNDYVVDHETNEWFIVKSLDSYLVPKLEHIKRTDTRTLNEVDNLLRSVTRTSPDSYRAYLDTSVNPHTLTIDSRFKVGGSLNHHAQVFRGNIINASQKPISYVYDQHGTLVDTKILLELVKQDGMRNHTEKCVPTFHTTETMPDDELITVVIYRDDGGVSSIQEFYVYNTATVRATSDRTRYITDIRIESPFLSESDSNLIQFPLNVNLRGLNLFGVVEYSDGTSERKPISNTGGFAVLGLNDFVSTVIGYEHEFTLSYTLASNEAAVGTVPTVKGKKPIYHVNTITQRRTLNKNFRIKVVEPDGQYTVKLFAYPEWIDELNGYRMRFYMMDLDRSTFINVTNAVKYNKDTKAFDGLQYGSSQRLSVSVNLADVFGSKRYKDYIHTQIIDVVLQRNGADTYDYRWSVNFELTQDTPFGLNNWAKVYTVSGLTKRINIANDESMFTTWLNRMWKLTKPLYNEQIESQAPEPNMFDIIINGNRYSYDIDRWNTELEVTEDIKGTENVYVVFYKQTSDTNLYTGVAALPVFITHGV